MTTIPDVASGSLKNSDYFKALETLLFALRFGRNATQLRFTLQVQKKFDNRSLQFRSSAVRLIFVLEMFRPPSSVETLADCGPWGTLAIGLRNTIFHLCSSA